jgi:hypothetical protein
MGAVGRGAPEPAMPPEDQQQQFLSRLFLWAGILTVFFLLLY